MKFLRSIIFASALFFLIFTRALAAIDEPCKECRNQKCVSTNISNCTPFLNKCSRNANCQTPPPPPPPAPPAPPAGGGGDGSDGGGGDSDGGSDSLSTNIETQAKDFFAYQSFDKFLPNLLQIALILGAVAAFAFLIWGGIDYIISGGNQERVKTSKTMIGNALAGLAILAAAWVLWRLVTYFLGLSSTLKGPFDIKLPTP